MRKGITRRWMVNGFAVIVGFLVIVEIAFMVAVRSYYYQGVETALSNRAETYRNSVSMSVAFSNLSAGTVDLSQRAQELVAEIYSHAKYTVADAEKLKSGDLAVEVTVSPIEIIPLLTSDFMGETWNTVLENQGITTQEQLDARFQEADEEYAMALLDELERLIPEITYGEDQVIMLQMKEDEDGYYTLVDSGIQKVDEVMIDYYGSYAE